MTALLLVLTGCIATQRIVWSPDGKRAAVLGEDGLFFLCDTTGNLTGPFLTNVVAVAWFSDSQRLVLSRQDSYTNWTMLNAALTPEMRDTVRQQAGDMLTRLQAGTPKDQIEEAMTPTEKQTLPACALYLRDERGEQIRKALTGDDARNLDSLEVKLNSVQLVRLTGGRPGPGVLLARDFEAIWNIRVAPDGKAIAYTTMPEGDGGPRLAVVSAAGGQLAQVVDEYVAVFPDWTPDSRSLVYVKTANVDSKKDLTLGTLIRRQVVDEAGQINSQGDAAELAGLMFSPLARVRCLRDGRILFAAVEVQLPATVNDLPQREQFFVLDAERQATLTPLIPRGSRESLPENLSYFEVSPDEKRVAVADKNMVVVFTLASGVVDLVQAATDKELKNIPCWRSTNELCYVAFGEVKDGRRRAEVALWQNGKTNLLSATWPEAARHGWLD